MSRFKLSREQRIEAQEILEQVCDNDDTLEDLIYELIFLRNQVKELEHGMPIKIGNYEIYYEGPQGHTLKNEIGECMKIDGDMLDEVWLRWF